jgi:hypothetical protein
MSENGQLVCVCLIAIVGLGFMLTYSVKGAAFQPKLETWATANGYQILGKELRTKNIGPYLGTFWAKTPAEYRQIYRIVLLDDKNQKRIAWVQIRTSPQLISGAPTEYEVRWEDEADPPETIYL